MTGRFNLQLRFSGKKDISDFRGKFLAQGTVPLEKISPAELEKATIEVDKGRNKTYRTDILWYYKNTMTKTGTGKRKFEHLFKLAKFLPTIIQSNAKEESVFSFVHKKFDPLEGQFVNVWDIFKYSYVLTA